MIDIHPAPLLKVLVVDDCQDSVDMTALLVRLWGHEVCSARDGPTALALAASFRPD